MLEVKHFDLTIGHSFTGFASNYSLDCFSQSRVNLSAMIKLKCYEIEFLIFTFNYLQYINEQMTPRKFFEIDFQLPVKIFYKLVKRTSLKLEFTE